MSCCGGRTILHTETQAQRVEKLRNYYQSLQRHKCEYCGGNLKWFPGGIVICTTCRKRKN